MPNIHHSSPIKTEKFKKTPFQSSQSILPHPKLTFTIVDIKPTRKDSTERQILKQQPQLDLHLIHYSGDEITTLTLAAPQEGHAYLRTNLPRKNSSRRNRPPCRRKPPAPRLYRHDIPMQKNQKASGNSPRSPTSDDMKPKPISAP